MKARAYAKINLGLEVLFRRADGYHELRTLFQTIDFYDRLSFEPAGRGIELVVDHPDVPSGGDNLVVKAARALASRIGTSAGVRIVLDKRIPAGRGLGGGSADAAMTLVALNELWSGGLTEVELAALAVGIGMDVPYFLTGGTALGIGRGDEIYPLDCQLDMPLVLVLPEFAIATAGAYHNLVLTKRESSLKLQYFAPSCSGGRDKLLNLVNDLESATDEYSPAIQEYKEDFLRLGAAVSLMSGSGSSVFGLFHDEAVAHSAAQALTARGVRAIATHTLTRQIYQERRLESPPSGSSEP